jgi:hypothetical protein
MTYYIFLNSFKTADELKDGWNNNNDNNNNNNNNNNNYDAHLDEFWT